MTEANPDSKAESDEDWDSLSPKETAGSTSSQDPFQEINTKSTAGEGKTNLEFLMDLPLSVTVELGRAEMIIDKMLQLGQGSVIELEKAAGEPVEIFVNHKLLGKGEVIVVNDRFGVRITEIISQADRIKNIG
ncbi:MAG: flagellar motor switch protein FliN [Desulfobulbaceae bacterium]|uniref:Flagellar motor switch protein FliN n=1 Tax=Candidatus Desulfobia pelagia TaxID=2841692 RepID=A0A8J6NBV3_9BACT|nr:flagellar motor switch protein FliN [Candidatus Desulfobia pelagia]